MCRLVWLSLVILSHVNVPAIFALQDAESGFESYSGDGQFAGQERKWERMAEWTIESKKEYADPFNDVEVDVVFNRDGQSWRVPAFWRGGNKWTVRFAPPVPGEYGYHYESTDPANPDLKGHQGLIIITGYTGDNPLFKHGMLQISANGHYFQHSDGTPFYWLGDTWWSCLSDRISWDGFQKLAADRKAKGYTVIQICAGLIPNNEEMAPVDPGFHNEGGYVWDPEFRQINPSYFDFADRRIQHILDQGMVPAIVGGWRQVLAQMGVDKMKQHWRYVIARYGAYPAFWIGGGELFDPPEEVGHRLGNTGLFKFLFAPGWTEVVRYIRTTDPYHHPLTVHEVDPPYDYPVQDESLTDFDLFQAGHRGWPSIATEIAQLNKHYARTTITKPLVIGEIGYEKLCGGNYEDYQRAAFWLAMLNGAAGFTYGTLPVAEAYTADKPIHRYGILSLHTWEQAMTFPGNAQVAMAARLLRKYSWWKMAPHPEWVEPHGTTLLEPNSLVNGFNIDLIEALAQKEVPSDDDLPLGEWHEAHGNWRLPYAAGVPGEFRILYLPYFRFGGNPVPAILKLEPGIPYHAYYWDPVLGVKVDLGTVEAASGTSEGKINIEKMNRKLYDDNGRYRGELINSGWDEYGTHQSIHGDTYKPERPPTMGDWVLVLEALDQ